MLACQPQLLAVQQRLAFVVERLEVVEPDLADRHQARVVGMLGQRLRQGRHVGRAGVARAQRMHTQRIGRPSLVRQRANAVEVAGLDRRQQVLDHEIEERRTAGGQDQWCVGSGSPHRRKGIQRQLVEVSDGPTGGRGVGLGDSALIGSDAGQANQGHRRGVGDHRSHGVEVACTSPAPTNFDQNRQGPASNSGRFTNRIEASNRVDEEHQLRIGMALEECAEMSAGSASADLIGNQQPLEPGVEQDGSLLQICR